MTDSTQITHCPECTTAFKVTPAQLEVAGGWVRCGRCGAVFEALSALTPAAPRSPSRPLEGTTQPLETSLEMQSTQEGEAPTSTRRTARTARSTQIPPDEAAAARAPTSSSALEPPQAPQRAHWVWASACGLLALILCWQAVIYKRDWLLAQEPALRPVLLFMCGPFGCQPQWPRLPESLQIETSSFTRDPQGFFSIQVRVKNNAHFPLAAPHVELTLLDVYDDVLVRRVLTPQELKLAHPLTALRDARAGLDFDLSETVAAKVTGYRVFLFYP